MFVMQLDIILTAHYLCTCHPICHYYIKCMHVSSSFRDFYCVKMYELSMLSGMQANVKNCSFCVLKCVEFVFFHQLNIIIASRLYYHFLLAIRYVNACMLSVFLWTCVCVKM